MSGSKGIDLLRIESIKREYDSISMTDSDEQQLRRNALESLLRKLPSSGSDDDSDTLEIGTPSDLFDFEPSPSKHRICHADKSEPRCAESSGVKKQIESERSFDRSDIRDKDDLRHRLTRRVPLENVNRSEISSKRRDIDVPRRRGSKSTPEEALKRLESRAGKLTNAPGSSSRTSSSVSLHKVTNVVDFSRSIFIGNIFYGASEEDLEHLFAGFGSIKKVMIPRTRFDGRSQGYAFIEFDSRSSVGKALVMHNWLFRGRKLIVERRRLDSYVSSEAPAFSADRRYNDKSSESSRSSGCSGPSRRTYSSADRRNRRNPY